MCAGEQDMILGNTFSRLEAMVLWLILFWLWIVI